MLVVNSSPENHTDFPGPSTPAPYIMRLQASFGGEATGGKSRPRQLGIAWEGWDTGIVTLSWHSAMVEARHTMKSDPPERFK